MTQQDRGLKLYGHPFSSYTQKVLIALYENGTPFDFRKLDDENAAAEWLALWPLRRFPLLAHGTEKIAETSIIIEYLALHHAGPVPLIPADPQAALDVRMMDRFFDLYIHTPMQKVVFDSVRAAESRDAYGVAEARQMLDLAYRWLDETMANREWAVGREFSLADCSAAPALFYADWVHPIDAAFSHLTGYRRRLLARPSFARAVDGGRPYRAMFPLGAPDRD